MGNFTIGRVLLLLAAITLCMGQIFPEKEDTYRIIEEFFHGLREKEAEAESQADERVGEDAIVRIKNGTLQGVSIALVTDEVTDKRVYAYRRIPFAAPPVGELRFEPPQSFLEGFGDQIYDATKHTPACAQFLSHLQPASEDCLFLNVYSNRPANSTDTSLRPVMVFLHGGAFILGESAMYTGRRLLIEDIIVVVPNYRLSVFGFLSTGDDVVPGNMALKDAVLALRWVQENIADFGGDPTKVTLSGESAGSALASYIHISPMAKGLFHRTFLMSGVANSEWAIDRNPRLAANLFADAVDCPTESTTAMVQCLKGKNWKQLSRIAFENLYNRLVTSFRIELPGVVPVIEPDIPGAFITEDPIKILQERDIPEGPVMLGAVQHEGVLPMAIAVYAIAQPWGLIFDEHWLRHDMISQLMGVYGVDDSANGGTLSQTVALSFFANSSKNNFDDMAEDILDMLSVAFMKAPILRKAEILTERGRDVFLYSFEHYGRNSIWNFIKILIDILYAGKAVTFKTGVIHGDDLQYMFNTPVSFTPDDIKVSRTYIKLAANFVIHGNPSPEDTPDIPRWPKYDMISRNYLKIDSTPTVMEDFSSAWRQRVPI